ncbi:Imm50 family immunity protein [Streptomyces sp. NPDC059224]|uniref:Imm50 family immunity protein n=1 Tax=Streptomyces sp. NPDC059224 TaxID=3346775 RepID=UPI0036C540FB
MTLGSGARALPVNVPPEWRERGFSSFEFPLVFEGVARLRVTGWGAAEAEHIAMTSREGAFDVVLGSGDSAIAFGAATVRPARTHAYVAAGSP